MHHLSVLSSMAFMPAVLLSALTGQNGVMARAGDRGSDIISGLGARKQAVLDAGGNTRDLAIAMLETTTMTTDYLYGDGKKGDATNFGILKQNYFAYTAGASSDLAKDIQARHEGEENFLYEIWFSGHRNGESGVQNPGTDDIKSYIDAVAWIQKQIESDPRYQSDDTRFWVDVQAI
ncbi:hypothetical protein BDW71DRAFT_211490 [Aspergillus fruticulosus]